jgi:predicted TIM-barrel fold metal-dependent hydrolase
MRPETKFMIKVTDSHVHYHIFLRRIPQHCSSFLANVEDTRFELTYQDLEVEKVMLVPSHPCWSQDCSDGFDIDLEVSRKNPELFLLWGEVNPVTCDVKKELERQYSLGIVGIKLHPVHHGFPPNGYREEEGGDRNLEFIYQFAQDNRLPVLVHTGTSVGVRSRNKFGDPMLLDDVIKDFNLNLILAHAGRPIWYESAFFLARNYPNVYLEISSIPPKNLLKVLPRLPEIKEKVIYGSDFPAYRGQNLAKHAWEVFLQVKDQGVMSDNVMRLIAKV